MKNTQDIPNYDKMSAQELRGMGIGEATAIIEMSAAKKEGNEKLYLHWENVYKKLKAK